MLLDSPENLLEHCAFWRMAFAKAFIRLEKVSWSFCSYELNKFPVISPALSVVTGFVNICTWRSLFQAFWIARYSLPIFYWCAFTSHFLRKPDFRRHIFFSSAKYFSLTTSGLANVYSRWLRKCCFANETQHHNKNACNIWKLLCLIKR